MGNMFGKLFPRRLRRNKIRLVMVGLDGAGKTSIVYHLKRGDCVSMVPTHGFDVKFVEYNNLTFTIFDVGGKDYLRPLWRHYYHDTHAFIFVVDSSDHGRLDVVTEEISKLIIEVKKKDAILLVLANKQDLPSAMSVTNIAEQLRLHSLEKKNWHIQGSCAITGDGLSEGMDWLTTQLIKVKI